MKKRLEETTLALLLSGIHPQAKKYAGHHVLVVNDKVYPLKEGEDAHKDIGKLEKKYGKTPVITFVPRRTSPIKIGNWEKQIPVGFLERNDIPPLLGRLECLESVRLTFENKESLFGLP